ALEVTQYDLVSPRILDLPDSVIHFSWHDVVCLHHFIGCSVMVHRNEKPIQRGDQESSDGVKRSGNLAKNIVAIAFFGLLPNSEERSTDHIEASCPCIINRVIVITLAEK